MFKKRWVIFSILIITGNHAFNQVHNAAGNILMCTDTNGMWTGGFVGFGVGKPKQMIDVSGKIKVHDMVRLNSEHPVVIWNETDSNFNVMGIDSLTYFIQKNQAFSPSLYGTWLRDTVNGELYQVKLKDQVGIGKADPDFDLDVSGTISSANFRSSERNYHALITFSFDDGFKTDYSVMLPVFIAKGEVAVSHIVTNWIGSSNNMTWTQVQALQENGWEIASHSKSHAAASTLNYSSMIAEYGGSKDTLEAHGLKVNNMAYPYNIFNDSAMMVARMFYRASRSSISGGVSDTLNKAPLKTYALTSYPADNPADINTYKSLIDRAQASKRWLIFYLHQTDAADANVIGQLIDYIHAKSNVSIVTYDQALDIIGNSIDVADGFAVNNDDLRIDGTIYRGSLTGQRPFIHTYSHITATGFNTFVGYDAGNQTMSPGGGPASLSSYNTGVGYQSQKSLTTGYNNTGVGFQSLSSTSSGYNNTAIGKGAMFKNTTGYQNTTVGNLSGYCNLTGFCNTYISDAAGYYSTGSNNVMVGNQAGYGVSGRSIASNNIGIGSNSLFSICSGASNVAIGTSALFSDSTGSNNTVIGDGSFRYNFSASGNTGLGSYSGYYFTGGENTFIGCSSGTGVMNMSTGIDNATLGYESNNKITSGSYNTSLGARSGFNNKSGSNNVFLGYKAGYSSFSGSQNVLIGYCAGFNEPGSQKLYIANSPINLADATTNDGILIFGDFDKNYLNLFNRLAIGQVKNPATALEVVGSGVFTGYLKSGHGVIADNDSSPDVSGYNTFIYSGSNNSVEIESLTNAVEGVYYIIIGNSDTYTVTLIDSGIFNLNDHLGAAILGSDDNIVFYSLNEHYFIEISRSDN